MVVGAGASVDGEGKVDTDAPVGIANAGVVGVCDDEVRDKRGAAR